MFENGITIHKHIMPARFDHLLAYRTAFAAAPRIFYKQLLGKPAVGVEVCR
ncbi:hypothetical protein D3C87_2049870 [compost metagenome]